MHFYADPRGLEQKKYFFLFVKSGISPNNVCDHDNWILPYKQNFQHKFKLRLF